jgi:hypothetical protein
MSAVSTLIASPGPERAFNARKWLCFPRFVQPASSQQHDRRARQPRPPVGQTWSLACDASSELPSERKSDLGHAVVLSELICRPGSGKEETPSHKAGGFG